jgi:hypothetical protein
MTEPFGSIFVAIRLGLRYVNEKTTEPFGQQFVIAGFSNG